MEYTRDTQDSQHHEGLRQVKGAAAQGLGLRQHGPRSGAKEPGKMVERNAARTQPEEPGPSVRSQGSGEWELPLTSQEDPAGTHLPPVNPEILVPVVSTRGRHMQPPPGPLLWGLLTPPSTGFSGTSDTPGAV